MTYNHTVVWLRRDLRLNDNSALTFALQNSRAISLVFLFDPDILRGLPSHDRRLTFIWESLEDINAQLRSHTPAKVQLYFDKPEVFWSKLIPDGQIDALFFNHDYEPKAIRRDEKIRAICNKAGIACQSFKDQVFFEKGEIVKDDGTPYKVFTAFKNKWLQGMEGLPPSHFTHPKNDYSRITSLKLETRSASSLEEIGFKRQNNLLQGGETACRKLWKDYQNRFLLDYDVSRDIPALERTSNLSTYLRFGNISVRELVSDLRNRKEPAARTFLSELIWREFFMMILYQFPHVETRCFQPRFDTIKWLNDKNSFDAWRSGRTGYPIVDAGMRQLNATGLMHNRVRMITASFLVKHLHIDWRKGERYFAEKLLDYELSSNNGNWQWAAGTGVDAAPYFRIFNPLTQGKKFDPEAIYIKRWIPELTDAPPKSIHNLTASENLSGTYPPPIIDLDRERKTCLELYEVR